MKFQIKNSDIFPMPGDSRFLHLATVSYSLREFVSFVCIKGPHKGQVWIEEVVLESNSRDKSVVANLRLIDDDNLIEDIYRFLEDKKLMDIAQRMNQVIDQGNYKWIS